MSLLSMLKPKGPNGFGYGSTAEDVTAGVSLAGKTIMVTGTSSGLGLEAVRVLAMRGAHVIATARTADKAKAAFESVVRGDTAAFGCELAEPASVLECVAKVKDHGRKLDALILNAGVMALPKLELAHGYERQFFTNHIGHFILTTGLLDMLADDARVVVLSSGAHMMAPKEGIQFDNLAGEKGYRAWTAYGQSKFANLLFAKELARRFAGTRKTANAVHPGVIKTNLGRHMNPLAGLSFVFAGPLVLKSIPEGAATECYVAANPGAAGISGEYFQDCNVAKHRADGGDPELAKRLWERSEEITASVTGRGAKASGASAGSIASRG
jgi:NAD(P)-dependent dehydrogenase (short-subunit alcohol dehydrogenase family)